MDGATRSELQDVVARALAEDVGDGDRTTLATIPAGARTRATMLQKEPGVLFGLDAAELVFRTLDARAEIERLAPEGVVDGCARPAAGRPARRPATPARCCRPSARRSTSCSVSAASRRRRRASPARSRGRARRSSTRARRRRACACSRRRRCAPAAGVNHRIGLCDELLVKNNHIDVAGGVAQATRAALGAYPDLPLEVECRDDRRDRRGARRRRDAAAARQHDPGRAARRRRARRRAGARSRPAAA